MVLLKHQVLVARWGPQALVSVGTHPNAPLSPKNNTLVIYMVGRDPVFLWVSGASGYASGPRQYEFVS